MKTDYLKREIFSKYVSKETAPPDVRAQRALNKWLATERNNEATTDRLLFTHAEYNILPRVTYQRFMEWCTDFIVGLLGETPPVDALIGSFSGGASTSRSRTQSQPANKYVGKADATADCLGLFSDIVVEEVPGWIAANAEADLTVRLRRGNAMFTVPKNTDIDRVAAKEPDLNMFIQKGIGNYFRSALRRAGINLNDQSINRSLALRGSIDGSLATLDLSSASDSVTTELVFQMLPVCWYTLLDSARSRSTVLLDGSEHRNTMFSSMGNGFTFELESLLFYVLMKATAYFTGTRGIISVYGDDLIIPTEMANDAIWILGYFGFEVNTSKSFTEGPIRESCGGHYWNGFDITPFYIKEPIEQVHQLILVANKLRKWGEFRINGELLSPIIDPEIEPIWLWLKSLIPSCLWGGEDLQFKYQLASYDVATSRLYELKDSRKAGLGGFPHWLNTTWDRTSVYDLRIVSDGSIEIEHDPIETSVFTVSRSSLELRRVRNKAVPQLETLFTHEVGLVAEEGGG